MAFLGACTADVCKRETLRAAYEMAKQNDGAPGTDGATFEAIDAGGVESFLDQLREEPLTSSAGTRTTEHRVVAHLPRHFQDRRRVADDDRCGACVPSDW